MRAAVSVVDAQLSPLAEEQKVPLVERRLHLHAARGRFFLLIGLAFVAQFKAIPAAHLDRWKEEITALEANLVTRHFGHVLDQNGYEKLPWMKGKWKPTKGESLKRYVYNRLYPLYLH